MCMWSVAFKLQKKDEKTEDSSSASSEFSKIRKASDGYFFVGSLDRSLEQQWKKKNPTQTTAVTYSANQQKKAEKWGWVTAHTRPEPARQSSEHRKMKLRLLRNCAWLFQNYHFSLNYYTKKKTKWAWGVAKTLAGVVLVHQFKQTWWDGITWVKI